MRVHPISLALRSLRGQRSLHGRQLQNAADAVATLREFTGQDFGQDAARWGSWLRANRWVYTAGRDEPRSEGEWKS
jgi:hypothetical protein